MTKSKVKIILGLFGLLLISAIAPIRVSASYNTYVFWEDSAPADYIQGGDIFLDTNYPVSDFYIDFFIAYGNEKHLKRVYIETYQTVNIDSSLMLPFTDNNNSYIPYRLYDARYLNNDWMLSNSQSNWITNGFYLTNQYTTVVYISKSTVPINFNNTTYEPTAPYEDNHFASKDDFKMHYGVAPTENSEVFSYYYRTQKYIPEFTFTVDSTEYTYRVPSNVFYSANLVSDFDYTGVPAEDILNLLDWHATSYYIYDQYMQGVAFGDNTAFANAFDECTVYISYNTLTLNQLLAAVNDVYSSNLTINDLYTTITYNAIDITGSTAYTYNFDYSALYDSGVTPPPDDPEQDDQTKLPDILNQALFSTNTMLKELITGKPYIKQGYEDITVTWPTGIGMPEFEYTETELDGNAMDLFGWIVDQFFTSPMAIVFYLALSFLIIRTILW